jgi:NAD(P)-dependent dehydrogenase (short-subunit alcohol dehydrogenase family)
MLRLSKHHAVYLYQPDPYGGLHSCVRDNVLRDISDTHSVWRISMSTLAGKKALITHSGDGLGFAIAVALGQQQAELIVHDRSPAVAGVAVERLKLAIPGLRASAICADLASESGRQQLLESVGPIDIVVSDSVGEGITDFAQVSEAQLSGRQQASSRDSEALAGLYAQVMSGRGWGRMFLVTSVAAGVDAATFETGEQSVRLLPHEVEHQASGSGVEVFRLPIASRILEPVADVMKSEVMRTGNSLEEVASQMARDHRPLEIQKAARTISELTQLITDACLS